MNATLFVCISMARQLSFLETGRSSDVDSSATGVTFKKSSTRNSYARKRVFAARLTRCSR